MLLFQACWKTIWWHGAGSRLLILACRVCDVTIAC